MNIFFYKIKLNFIFNINTVENTIGCEILQFLQKSDQAVIFNNEIFHELLSKSVENKTELWLEAVPRYDDD